MIKLYNSLTRKLEEFVPQDPNRVTMYVCGPTVYSAPHIGNARPAVVFDVLYRLLMQNYRGRVHYARNITDIDDKIIAAANERGISTDEVAQEACSAYISDLKSLNVLNPTCSPLATRHIPDMIQMISQLIAKGHAYVVDGEVFFHVPSNPHTGLAQHSESGLRSGERVAVDSRKRDPRDFVLWKPAKPDEPAWESPWSDGRPGWHIECSAMIQKNLGLTIDIHGGGQDLRFPHHEAECAQSHCANDAPLANYWLHNGLLTVDGQKMSKSVGNVVLLNEPLSRFPGESIRFYMLLTHYRSPMDWTRAGLAKAHRGLNTLYEALYEYDHVEWDEHEEPAGFFMEKLAHDLNTPGAIANLHLMAENLHEKEEKSYWKSKLIASGRQLGLFYTTPKEWMTLGVDVSAVEVLLAEREKARSARDWTRADDIRDQLAHMGITVADGVHGTQWRKT